MGRDGTGSMFFPNSAIGSLQPKRLARPVLGLRKLSPNGFGMNTLIQASPDMFVSCTHNIQSLSEW